MGINDIPDENDILTPDSKTIRLLLERLRRVLEGTTDLPTPISSSDHRISQLYHISEAEKKVIDEINKIKEQREADSALDYTNVKEYDDHHDGLSGRSPARKQVDPSAADHSADQWSDDQGDGLERDVSFRDHDVSVTMVTPALPTFRSSGRSTSPTKKEELRRKARQMLENPAAAAFPTGTSQDDEKRRQEARRLIEEAVTDGATYLVGSELVRPAVSIHTFKKRDPSPILQRKQYDAVVPGQGRPIQMGNDRLKVSDIPNYYLILFSMLLFLRLRFSRKGCLSVRYAIFSPYFSFLLILNNSMRIRFRVELCFLLKRGRTVEKRQDSVRM
ncbi:hypothetical protein COOONC_04247 [Cooperia oncophora]